METTVKLSFTALELLFLKMCVDALKYYNPAAQTNHKEIDESVRAKLTKAMFTGAFKEMLGALEEPEEDGE